jgi:hypothetical protein
MSNIKIIYDLNEHAILSEYRRPDKFIAGAELEIEAIRNYSSIYQEEHAICMETDGSLRNNGREFLLPPRPRDILVDLFEGLHGHIELGNDPFSVRTSIHVHVNCLYASPAQVKALLLLYAIFEPLAFNFAGPVRRDNIHCMPLNSTHMPNLYSHTLEVIHSKWHKYTAFNLLPLSELGTVEFRHLYGTDDQHVFKAWLDFIATLWYSAMNMGEFKKEYLTDLTFLRDVQSKLMTKEFLERCIDHQPYVLEDNLLDVKLAFI